MRVDQQVDDIKKRPISIGDGCFIGANSIILKGTILGKNCVVGAGSVVLKKVKAGETVFGIPAMPI